MSQGLIKSLNLICMAQITKVTVSYDDGTVQDVTPGAATPTQSVTITAGQSVEVIAQ